MKKLIIGIWVLYYCAVLSCNSNPDGMSSSDGSGSDQGQCSSSEITACMDAYAACLDGCAGDVSCSCECANSSLACLVAAGCEDDVLESLIDMVDCGDDPGTDSDVDTDTDTDTDTDLDSDSDTDTNSDTGSDSESDSDSSTGTEEIVEFELLSPEHLSTISGLFFVQAELRIPFNPSEVDVGFQLYLSEVGVPEVGGRVKMFQVGDSNLFEAVINTVKLGNEKFVMKADVLLPDSETLEDWATFTIENTASLHGTLYLPDGITPLPEGNITLSIDSYPVTGTTSDSNGSYALSNIPASENYTVRVWRNPKEPLPNINPIYKENIYNTVEVMSGSDLEMNFNILDPISVSVSGGAPSTDASTIFYNGSVTGNLGYLGFLGFYDSVNLEFEVEMSEVDGYGNSMQFVSPRILSDFAQDIPCEELYTGRYECSILFSPSIHLGPDVSYEIRLYDDLTMSAISPVFDLSSIKIDGIIAGGVTWGTPHISCSTSDEAAHEKRPI